MLDIQLQSIVDRALDGERISGKELLPLFEFDAMSGEVAHVRWAARTIASKATNNQAQIYAQIGLDALPCPVDCDFCSFSRQVSSGVGLDAVVPLDDVVRYAQIYDEAGVHLISLMATAALPFSQLLETVAAVRKAVSPDMPILINAADMSLERACQLKDAGAQAAYHAHRIGEGSITKADPQVRLQTMRNIKQAGLKLMNAVEPLCADTPLPLIVERMEEAIAFEPYCSGVDPLTPVAGTPMEHKVPISRMEGKYYAALMRLMAGESIPYGVGSGNVVWADAGTNPRGRNLPINPQLLQRNVASLRKGLIRNGWDVPARPLDYWFS